ncbi:MAG: hypothetical protein ACI38Q_07095 [Candidatus Bruticola sp.]
MGYNSTENASVPPGIVGRIQEFDAKRRSLKNVLISIAALEIVFTVVWFLSFSQFFKVPTFVTNIWGIGILVLLFASAWFIHFYLRNESDWHIYKHLEHQIIHAPKEYREDVDPETAEREREEIERLLNDDLDDISLIPSFLRPRKR